MPSPLRLTGKILLIALLVVAVAAGGLYLWLRSSLPQTSGTIPLSGLSSGATIDRDARGLVQIRAASAEDAYFALGFVHAQDRLWQMESTRLFGRGRLAEVAGERFVAQDRLMRTLGIGRAADASYAALSPAARDAVDAYARGVNAFLDHHQGALPPEFALLFHRPEPWRPSDSLIWGRLMALALSGNWRRQLTRARMAKILSPDRVRQLYPPYPDDAPVTVGGSRRAQAPSPEMPAMAPDFPFALLMPVLPPAPAADTASNSWVVSGARTRSGAPLLANDPHLALRAPNLWYLARIEAPGLSLSGVTAPGVPFHVLGHNGAIAWGMTTTGADTQDLVIERIVPGDSTRYVTPDGTAAFMTREEVIRVRGGKDLRFIVRETRNGPVVSDLSDDAAQIAGSGAVLSLRSPVFASDDATGNALWRINRARNWQDFTDALTQFHAPVQNIFYADAAGHIGFSVAGRIPLRGARDSRLPANGTRADHDWTGFIPAGELPRSFDPSRGLLTNANNKVTGPLYPHVIARDWEEPWRAIRLEELASTAAPHDPDRARAIQIDDLSTAARTLVPVYLRLTPRTDGNAPLLDLLSNWDFRAGRDSAAALVYTSWTAHLAARLFSDELAELNGEFSRIRPLLLLRTLTADTAWCDDVTTKDVAETCSQVLATALGDARAELTSDWGPDPAKWRWGAAHKTHMRNTALDWLPLAGPLTRIEVETDGDDSTLNRGTSRNRARRGGYPHVHGATLRAIYDMARPDEALFSMPGGQSGNPLSPHYRDLTLPWRDGIYVKMPAAAQSGARRLTLAPRS
jgi:penicillin amidase